MAIVFSVGNPPRAISEFPHVNGKTLYTDACGPNAYEILAANLAGVAPDQSAMTAIRNDMIAHGQFTPGGGCTIANLQWFAQNDALRITGFHDNEAAYQQYQEALPESLIRSWLTQYKTGLIIEIGAAYKLPFNEPGVHYHFVVLLAYDDATDRVLVANGDRLPAGGPDWMTLAEVAAADVCGMLALDTPAHAGSGGGNMAIPNGWTDDGTTLTAPNKVPVVFGFRNYILSHSWDSADVPQAPEYDTGALLYEDGRWGGGALLVCTYTVLMFPHNPDPSFNIPSGSVIRMPVGIEYKILRDKVDSTTITPPPPPPPPPTPVTFSKIESAALDFAHAIEGK